MKSCEKCCHRPYCYANTGWFERAETCSAYNDPDKKDIVIII